MTMMTMHATVSLAKVLKVALPAVVSGLLLSQATVRHMIRPVAAAPTSTTTEVEPPSVNFADPNLVVSHRASLEAQGSAPAEEKPETGRASSRKVRVEQILARLNRIAEVSIQMEPTRSSALEPVIVDLAEQAMALPSDDGLSRLEKTLARLTKAVQTSVEPEVSL